MEAHFIVVLRAPRRTFARGTVIAMDGWSFLADPPLRRRREIVLICGW